MGNLLNMSGGSLLKKGGLLPSGYKQLEYIENTSDAYIDTGVKLSTSHKCVLITKYEIYRNEFAFFGSFESGTPNHHMFVILNPHSNNVDQRDWAVYINTYNVDRNCPISQTAGKKLTITWNDNFYVRAKTFDNTFDKSIYVTPSTYTSPNNCYLFATNNDGSIDWHADMKVYSFEMYESNTLVRNFIPCLSPNNVVGMYDTVEGKFYSSPNGTAFVAGPEV